MTRAPDDPIAFAERVLGLLGQAHFTATYKYAVLLALIDTSMETRSKSGTVPATVPTSLLAEKVVELYWPQVNRFPRDAPKSGAMVLKQNNQGQAAIVTRILKFRDQQRYANLVEARAHPSWSRLVRSVEWKLAEMPLPRLQTLGRSRDRFIYEIGWAESITYRRFNAPAFDRSVQLKPGVGSALIRLSPLLRPAIQREWAAWIARQQANQDVVKDALLEAHLFGYSRRALRKVLPGLRKLQKGQCFYGNHPLGSAPEVDHFIPWSRYPDDGIHNLVAACRRCNNARRNTLAGRPHLKRWASRLADNAAPRIELDRLIVDLPWFGNAERTMSVARSVYSSLPEAAAVWLRPGHTRQAGAGLEACLK